MCIVYLASTTISHRSRTITDSQFFFGYLSRCNLTITFRLHIHLTSQRYNIHRCIFKLVVAMIVLLLILWYCIFKCVIYCAVKSCTYFHHSIQFIFLINSASLIRCFFSMLWTHRLKEPVVQWNIDLTNIRLEYMRKTYLGIVLHQYFFLEMTIYFLSTSGYRKLFHDTYYIYNNNNMH